MAAQSDEASPAVLRPLYPFLPQGEISSVVRVADCGLSLVNPALYGLFFTNEVYLVTYQPRRGSPLRYVWIGKGAEELADIDSTLEEAELGQHYSRVREGAEPTRFRLMFKGRLMVAPGGHPPCAPGRRPTAPSSGPRLFRVSFKQDEDSVITEVPPVAASLDSRQVFFLETGTHNYLWTGKMADLMDAVEGSLLMFSTHRNKPVVIFEGSEPEEFWAGLDGQADHSAEDPSLPVLGPRLFHLDKATVGEVFDFGRKDLDSDGVFILRTWNEEFVWVGSEASNAEWLAAKHYCMESRLRDFCIIVRDRKEPKSFAALFPDWDADFLSNDI